MVTVAFSELRQNLTQVAEKVANEGEEVVVSSGASRCSRSSARLSKPGCSGI